MGIYQFQQAISKLNIKNCIIQLFYIFFQLAQAFSSQLKAFFKSSSPCINQVWDPFSGIVTLTFPPQYVLSTNMIVTAWFEDGIPIGCIYTISGSILNLTNVFQRKATPKNVTVLINNVLNPTPAFTTTCWTGTVDSDTAVANNGTCKTTLAPSTFSSCQFSFNPKFVTSTAALIFNVTTKNKIPANGYLQIIFPYQKWASDSLGTTNLPITATMSCTSLSSNVLTSLACSGSLANRKITVTNLFSAQIPQYTNFAFQVNNFLSPPSDQALDGIFIMSYDSSARRIDNCTQYISDLLPKVIPSSQISITAANGSSFQMNGMYQMRFTFQTLDMFYRTDYFQIIVPTGEDFTFNQSSVLGATTLVTSNATYQSQIITVYQSTTGSTTFAAPYTMWIQVGQYVSPSTPAETGNWTINIVRNGHIISTGSKTLSADVTTLTASITSRGSLLVGFNTSFTFSITTVIAITFSGKISITLPSQMDIGATSSNCAVINGTNLAPQPTCTFDRTNKIIMLTDLNVSNTAIPTQTLTLTLNGIRNPFSAKTSSSFTIKTYMNSSDTTLNSIGTISGITSTVAAMRPQRITITSNSFIVGQTLKTYTITINLDHFIPVGAYFYIFIPKPITIATASLSTNCFRSLNGSASASTTCSLNLQDSTGYKILISNPITTSLAIGDQLSFSFTNIINNPVSTAPVSSFRIESYTSDNFAIARIDSYLDIAMTTGAALSMATYSRASNKNYDLTTYTFSIRTSVALDASSIIFVKFPTQIILTMTSTCSLSAPSTNSSLICSFNSSSEIQITLPAASISANTTITFTISDIRNPTSYLTPGDFSIVIKTSDSLYNFASGSTTNKLTNSVPSSFLVISGTFSSYFLGDSISIALSIQPFARAPSSLIITFPTYFLVPSSLSCSGFSGFTGGSCSSTATRTINLTGTFTLVQFNLTVSGFQLPNSVPASTPYITVNSYDSNGLLIDSSSTDISFSYTCNLPCKTCDSSNKSMCFSCYSNSSINSNIIYNSITKTCQSSCPTGYYKDLTLSLCYQCDSNCKTCQNSAKFCLTCDQTTNYKYLNISSASDQKCVIQCPYGMYPDTTQNPVVCAQCTSPCLKCTSASFCQICPAGTAIGDSTSGSCQVCSTTCKTCLGTIANCTTCNSPYFAYNGSCTNTCPSPSVFLSGINTCGTCVSHCKTCSVVSSNCTSCQSTSSKPFLHNNDCISKCPSLYYNGTGVCNLCSSLSRDCDYCTNSTYCEKCNTGYVFLNGTCYSSTPTGYVNISGSAIVCVGDCATCSITPSNCTSCTNNNLYNFTCIASCPNTMIALSQICTACTSPCLSCSVAVTNCTSCIPNLSPNLFLRNNACIQNCPDFFFANTVNSQCDACQSPCSKCTNLYVCTTCVATHFLYSSSCLSACPSTYVGINNVCQACTSPCETCVDTQTKCLTCVYSYYFKSDNNECTQNCGTGFYKEFLNQTCIACTAPCQTCVNSTDTCLSCTTGTLYKNKCLALCPVKTYNDSVSCFDCPLVCEKCSSSTSCSDCIPGYYLINDKCENLCPANYYYAADTCNLCNTLSRNCQNCINATYCNTCDTGYVFLDGNCLSAPPSGYVNISGNALACTGDCATCQVTQSNCTSCKTNSLDGNTCTSTCPTTTIPLNRICVACVSPCKSCSNDVNNCTSCLTSISPNVFLINNQCLQTCPSNSFANTGNYQCTLCTSPCQKCTDATHCITCLINFVYYSSNQSCLNACPPTYYALNKVCESCISPCSECIVAADNCTKCLNGFYYMAAQYKCLQECGLGYFQDKNGVVSANKTCEPCNTKCLTCDLLSTNCTSCDTSSSKPYLHSFDCLANCPTNYFEGNGNCILCSSLGRNCQDCINSTYCNTCDTGYIFLSGNCLSTPPSGYVNISGTALACTGDCATCQVAQSNCTSCKTNNLDGNTCTSTCPTTTIPLNRICVVCVSPCKSCSNDVNNCTSCLTSISPSVFLTNNRCKQTCPDYFYANTGNNECTACVAPCSKCTSATACTSCNSTHFLNGTDCVPSCSSTYVGINNICETCIAPCATCTEFRTKCLTCTASHFLLNTTNQCLTDCGDGLYEQTTNSTCVYCSSPCKTCQVSPTNCTSCLTGKLYSNECKTTCPTKTYNDTYFCLDCPIECSTCSSSIVCSACINTHYLLNGSCYSDCPQLYYKGTNVCILCSSLSSRNCDYCINDTYCDRCNTGYVFLAGDCVSPTPDGYVNVSGVAVACVGDCATCSITPSNCTSCTNNNLYNFTCIVSCPNTMIAMSQVCTACTSPCLSCSVAVNNCTSCLPTLSPRLFLRNYGCQQTCPDYFYANTANSQCDACQSPCEKCTNIYVCTTCVNGYSLYSTNSTCLDKCPPTYVSMSKVCQQCASPCVECQVNTTKCLTCINTHYFLQSSSSCVPECGVGYFQDVNHIISDNNTCGTCLPQCLQCDKTASNCTKCPTSTYVYFLDNDCLSTCPQLYFNDVDKCTLCSSLGRDCDYCINSTYCEKCNTGYVFLNGTCYSSTPTGYVNISGSAIVCVGDCATCSITPSNCTSCTNNNLYNFTCIASCPNTMIALSKVCTPCTSPCLSCSVAVTNCTSCIPNLSPNLFLRNNACIQNCPDFFFANTVNSQCDACQSPCEKCTNLYVCTTCVATHFLYSSSCLSACPSTYVGISNVCQACTSPCETCVDTQTKCLTCVYSYYFKSDNNECTQNCGTGFYKEFLNQTCIACTAPCQTCVNSTDTCLSCTTGTLYKNKCLALCPVKTYNDSVSCFDCPLVCEKCSSSTSCSDCIPGYYLINDKCENLCPANYYYAADTCNLCNTLSRNCQNCINATYCNTCDTGYVFLDGNCLSAPPSGYVNISGNALACTEDCATCQVAQSNCTSCKTNNLDGNTCTSTCPTTTIPLNRICVACVSPCKSCSNDVNNCTSCLTGLTPNLFLLNNRCQQTCPSNSFANTDNYQCTLCTSPCQKCTDATHCITCVINFVYYSSNQSCLNACPPTYYALNKVCESCISPCSECIVAADNCTKCLNGFYYMAAQYKCLQECGLGYFQDKNGVVSANKTCEPCNTKCLTCDLLSTNCTSCDTSSSKPYLHSFDCLANCPTNYFEGNGNCILCSSLGRNCQDCVNSTYCNTCDTGYIFLSGNCLSAAPSGYVNISGNALACTGDCATCQVAQSNCTSCKTNNLDGNTCTSTCPSTTIPLNRICVACVSPCKSCSNDVNNCTSCLTSISPSVFLTNNRCKQTCPDYFYANTGNNECTACVAPCSKCTSATACASCNSTHFLNGTDCVPSCSSTYVGINNICETCIAPCATCTEFRTKCLTCTASHYLLNTTNQCLTDCGDGLYEETTNSTCVYCSSPCKTCQVSPTNCTSCLTGKLYFNQCKTTCPTKTYNDTYFCLDCPIECSACSSSIVCSACINTHYLLNGSCYSDCPQLYYKGTNVCLLCSLLSRNCDYCLNDTYCDRCNTGYVFLAGDCVSPTPDGYVNVSGVAFACAGDCATCSITPSNCTSCTNNNLYNFTCIASCPNTMIALSKVCTACTSPCLSCSVSVTNCTSCIPNLSPNLFLRNDSCQPACPDYFFANTVNSQCDACQSPCQKCTNLYICTSCVSTHFLYLSACLTDCPLTYVGISNVCYPCIFPCQTCNVTQTTCLTCEYSYYYLNDTQQCLQDCGTGYYKQFLNQTCLACTAPCQDCINSTDICITCPPGRILYKNKCLINCPSNTYNDTIECFDCLPQCQTCLTLNKCTLCVSNYFLFNQTCDTECPTSHAIDINGTCTRCSEPNCLECYFNDMCFNCDNGYLIYKGTCVTTCPIGFEIDEYIGDSCIESAHAGTSLPTQQALIPFPFVLLAFLSISICFLSLKSYPQTHIINGFLGLLGFFQTISIVVFFGYMIIYYGQITGDSFMSLILISMSTISYYVINFCSIQQLYHFKKDKIYLSWVDQNHKHRKLDQFANYISIIVSHKIRNILFSNLFGKKMFSAVSIQTKRQALMNRFCMASLIPSILAISSGSLVFNKLPIYTSLFYACIDVVILALINASITILSIMNYYLQSYQGGPKGNQQLQSSQIKINFDKDLLNQVIINNRKKNQRIPNEQFYTNTQQDLKINNKLNYGIMQNPSMISQINSQMTIDSEFENAYNKQLSSYKQESQYAYGKQKSSFDTNNRGLSSRQQSNSYEINDDSIIKQTNSRRSNEISYLDKRSISIDDRISNKNIKKLKKSVWDTRGGYNYQNQRQNQISQQNVITYVNGDDEEIIVNNIPKKHMNIIQENYIDLVKPEPSPNRIIVQEIQEDYDVNVNNKNNKNNNKNNKVQKTDNSKANESILGVKNDKKIKQKKVRQAYKSGFDDIQEMVTPLPDIKEVLQMIQQNNKKKSQKSEKSAKSRVVTKNKNIKTVRQQFQQLQQKPSFSYRNSRTLKIQSGSQVSEDSDQKNNSNRNKSFNYKLAKNKSLQKYHSHTNFNPKQRKSKVIQIQDDKEIQEHEDVFRTFRLNENQKTFNNRKNVESTGSLTQRTLRGKKLKSMSASGDLVVNQNKITLPPIPNKRISNITIFEDELNDDEQFVVDNKNKPSKNVQTKKDPISYNHNLQIRNKKSGSKNTNYQIDDIEIIDFDEINEYEDERPKKKK